MKNKKVIIIGALGLIVILVAVFLIFNNSKSVAFKTSDGITITNKEVKSGTTIKELEIPKKEGSAFQYWTINGKRCKDTDKIKNGDLLEAVYKDIYVITFDTDGGSIVENKEIVADDVLTKPTDPTKEEYIFKYWSNGEIEYDFSQPITQNITLKAIWETKYYCEKGYTLKDKSCIKKTTINATVNKSCSKDEKLYDGKCIIDSPLPPLGKCKTGVYNVVMDGCYKDKRFRDEDYIGEPTGITCAGREAEGNFVLKNGLCYIYENAKVSYSCPSGYEKNNTKCSKTVTIEAKIREN